MASAADGEPPASESASPLPSEDPPTLQEDVVMEVDKDDNPQSDNNEVGQHVLSLSFVLFAVDATLWGVLARETRSLKLPSNRKSQHPFINIQHSVHAVRTKYICNFHMSLYRFDPRRTYLKRR